MKPTTSLLGAWRGWLDELRSGQLSLRFAHLPPGTYKHFYIRWSVSCETVHEV